MKITNKLNLPASIVAAVDNDAYSKHGADLSVTELLQPAQITYLMNKHADDLEEDVSDRIWSLLGQAVHSIIERAGAALESFNETTIISNFEGTTIKGTVDHIAFNNDELNDFKVTNVRKLKGGALPNEWIAQTNIYRWLIERETGRKINNIYIIAIFRDWSKLEAQRNNDYPKRSVERLHIPMWSDTQVEMFLRERIALIKMDPPPNCSEEDIWARPTRYALMKEGRKTAIKLYDFAHEAHAEAAKLGSKYSVEVRPGVAVRCQDYCPVSRWCEQWANDPRNRPQYDPLEAFNEPSTA